MFSIGDTFSMTRKGDRWSKRETQKLKDKWPDHTAEEIADMLPGRTTEAVESKAQRLNEKGELPDKNRSTSSGTSYSTSHKQVEKGGSQVKTVSGTITEVIKDTPRGMDASNGIGMKINGEWYYDTYSPSRFEDSIHGVAFSDHGFTVKGARLSGAEYTIEGSGSGKKYNRLQSYGRIKQGQSKVIFKESDIDTWSELGIRTWQHNDKRVTISIEKAEYNWKNADYKIVRRSGGGSSTVDYAESKESAEDIAIEYMAEHPDPYVPDSEKNHRSVRNRANSGR